MPSARSLPPPVGAVFLLLAGCPTDGPMPPLSCDTLAPVRVAACFAGPGDQDDPPGYGGASGDWSGVVAAIDTGTFPAECAHEISEADSPSAWSLRITTDAGDVYVGIQAPESVPPSVGTSVRVRASVAPGEFDPTDGFVELTVDDALRAWVGTAGTPEELVEPQGFVLATGASQCEEVEECGSWSGFALLASAAGEDVSIGIGATLDVGGFQVTNADLLHQTTSGGECPDWFVAEATAAISGP